MAAPGAKNDPAIVPEEALSPSGAAAVQQPSSAAEDGGDVPRKGVIGWVKGKIQKRNIAASMNSINLDEIEKNALTDTGNTGGEPSDLDIAMGLGNGGVVDPADAAVADEDKIDLEAENDEGLLVGWGKKLQHVEWVNKTVQVVEQQVTNHKEQAELREIHELYKNEIKKDPTIKELNKKLKKIKKNLKVQRLNGDRIKKRNTFQRNKEQTELDKKTARLKKAIWTFSNSSMNSHEYAKAMMRASARLARKGVKVHKSEKALAMEAAVLRNMHRMLAIQKQYTMAKRSCNDVSSFIKRCKGWLENKLADGEMCIMVLEATSKSMAIMYKETVQVQEALIPKFQDPASHTFKKERMKTILALPKGLRSMPSFLKGPSKPPMKISLRKQLAEDDPNLRGYKTFKEQTKAMEAAWKEEMKQYDNLLEVGGTDTKIVEEISDLGDSEDEIEANLAAVSIGAAAAKKLSPHVNLDEMVKKQLAEDKPKVEGEEGNTAEAEGEAKAEGEEEQGPKAEGEVGEAKVEDEEEQGSKAEGEGEAKVEGEEEQGPKAEGEEGEAKVEGEEELGPKAEGEEGEAKVEGAEGEEGAKAGESEAEDEGDAGGDGTGTTGADTDAAVDPTKLSAAAAEEESPPPTETAEEADAAALEAQKAVGGEVETDPDVDEEALPEEVKQEDLDNLLNKEAEEGVTQALNDSDNALEEDLHQIVDDALAVDAEAEVSDDDDDDTATEGKDESTNNFLQNTDHQRKRDA